MRARSRPRSGPQRAVALLAALLAAPAPLPAAEVAADAGAEAESSVRIVGSRRAHRDAGELLSPVDFIAGRDFARQGRSETTDMLRQLLPSYNVHAHPNSDEASTVRPAGLRGLAADQLLVLVNGRRRHRSAVISFTGSGVHDDAHGPDVGAIPAIALERIEVLRDGAAARYGSDAVAGAINFVLKEAPAGGAVETRFGQSYAGDGEERQLAASLGLPLGERGFVRLSGDWKERAATARSVQRADAQALIDAGNAAVEQPYAQVWGQPDLDDDWKGFVNLAAALGGGAEFYAFGNRSERTVTGGFYFRSPDDRDGVFSTTRPLTLPGGATLALPVRLVGDRAGAGGCPQDVLIASRLTPEQARAVAAAYPGRSPADLEAARRRAAEDDPDCFLFNQRFPGGFRPRFGGDLRDQAAVAGLRGALRGGLRYDLSASHGEHEIDFFMRRSINPSLGPDSPGSFRLGAYAQTERGLNLDLAYPLAVGAFASPLHAAAGLEWREAEFRVRRGEPDSWRAGSYAAQGFGVGANGFSGFGPAVAGRWERGSRARYLDLEGDVAPELTLGAALRWEDFDGFGTAATWKLSGLYRLHEALRLRLGRHTGFRAPTVGQQRITDITTAFVKRGDGSLALAQRATVRPGTPLARALGSRDLRPEKSDSFTVGALMDIGAAAVTLDYFYIAVDDRVTQSRSFDLEREVGPGRAFADRTALDAARAASGLADNTDLASVRYFINDFDTRTRGLDLTVAAPLALPAGGDSELKIAANWTKTRVVRRDPATVSAKRVAQLERSLPRFRAHAALRHDAERWRALARVNYYGNAQEHHVDSADHLFRHGAEVTLDLELGYRPAADLELVLGAENVFDNLPDRNPYARDWGSKYAENAPYGTRGGFYYLSARREF